jgi:hypothetical protein
VRKRPRADRSRSTSERSSVTLASTPSRRARATISVFIVLWLAWQVAVPLSYYAGDNVDDERFSWRMFSGVWLLQKSCTASVSEVRSQSGAALPDIRAISLERTLHSTWVNQLKKKNRPLVVEKVLRSRCESDASVTEVHYTRACSSAEDTRIPPVAMRFDCRNGTFVEP